MRRHLRVPGHPCHALGWGRSIFKLTAVRLSAAPSPRRAHTMAGSVPTACRVFTGLVGVAIAVAAYSIASAKVVLVGCNITEILQTDDDGCFVARGAAEGHSGTILLDVGSACLRKARCGSATAAATKAKAKAEAASFLGIRGTTRERWC